MNIPHQSQETMWDQRQSVSYKKIKYYITTISTAYMRKNELQNSCVSEGLSATETPPMRSSSAVTPLWKPFFGLHKAKTRGLVEGGWRQGQVSENVFFFFFGSISIDTRWTTKQFRSLDSNGGVWKGV